MPGVGWSKGVITAGLDTLLLNQAAFGVRPWSHRATNGLCNHYDFDLGDTSENRCSHSVIAICYKAVLLDVNWVHAFVCNKGGNSAGVVARTKPPHSSMLPALAFHSRTSVLSW